MRRLLLIILFLPWVVLDVNGQIVNYKSKWQIKPAVGVNIPLTKLLKGDIEDDLIRFDDKSFYWQFISAAYFFHKHWGLELNFQGATAHSISKKYDHFVQTIEAEKGNDFFITPTSSGIYNTFNIVSGHIEYGSLGLIYRLESNRLFLYPKLSIGVLSFYVDWAIVYLKEKDGNNVYTVNYYNGRRPQDHFCPALSVAGGYKLLKNVFFNIDLSTRYFKTDITFPVTTTDLNTEQQTVSLNRYKKNIFTLSAGAGFIIVIK